MLLRNELRADDTVLWLPEHHVIKKFIMTYRHIMVSNQSTLFDNVIIFGVIRGGVFHTVQ